MSRTFLFIRHGLSFSNVLHHQGFATKEGLETLAKNKWDPVNIPLTELGMSQAQVAGENFCKIVTKDIALVLENHEKTMRTYVRNSGLVRAEKTQQLFMEKASQILSPVPTIPNGEIDSCLRERYPGVGFFMTRRSFEEKYGDFLKLYQQNPYFATPPGGESFASREVDARTFMSKRLTSKEVIYGGREVILAFTHGGFMRAVERIACPEKDPDEIKSPSNCMMYVVKGRPVDHAHFIVDEFKKVDLLK